MNNTTPWPSFPSAKNAQDTLIKEVERLCKLGILKQQQASKGALPSFKVPNKNKTECFFSNFWVIKRLVRKPFPIPKNKHDNA
jgi:hypothetical protein